jgi:nicotinate-nucleotide adenylyltransferase
MRLGIFGGTFDPPHVGHLVLAAEARHQLKLERVLWVLTPDPPHKEERPITSLEIRLQLLQAAIEDDPAFVLSRVDIDRKPPHYALDTMRLLTQQYPDGELIYIMGSDSLRDLPTWHKPQDFVKSCKELGVMHRPGDLARLDEVEAKIPGLAYKVHWVLAPLLQISSTDIRQRAIDGRSYRYFLPPTVYQLIEAHRLYRE